MGRSIATPDLALLLGEACASAPAGAIIGIGADIEPITSFEGLAPDDPFLLRCFTRDERDYCQQGPAPAERFAARFAAKEAVVKALGATLTVLPHEVEIIRTSSGVPVARLCDAAGATPGLVLHISMGHTHALGYAVALAMREDA
jgi:holo-[acyl-carrier protein] synthase